MQLKAVKIRKDYKLCLAGFLITLCFFNALKTFSQLRSFKKTRTLPNKELRNALMPDIQKKCESVNATPPEYVILQHYYYKYAQKNK